MVRDHLILGCKGSAARTRLFREKDVDLKRTLESLRISEAISEQLKKIERNGTQEPVNFVQKQSDRLKKRSGNTGSSQSKKERDCKHCGGQHEWNKRKYL